MLPHFQAGQPLKAADLETLVRHIRDTEITSVIGGRLSRVSGGQSIVIDPPPISSGGGTTSVCPFQVTAANTSPSEWKFKVEFGLIGGKIPTGMYPGGIPPLIMYWGDGWVCAKVGFVANAIAVDSVEITLETSIPSNTDTFAYYPLAYISTDSSNAENPEQAIQNLCSQPVASVCDLAFTA